MIINTESIFNDLIITFINESGCVETYSEKIPESEMYNWNYCSKKNQETIAWNNKPINKKPSQKLDKFRLFEYLLTSLEKETQDRIFAKNLPKKFFCDIETEVLDEFPDPKNPKAKIQTIALCNQTDKMIVLGIKPLSEKQISDIHKDINEYFSSYHKKINFEYRCFDDEEEMLYIFMFKLLPKIPCLTGWNFIDFDWDYIIGRCRVYNFDLDEIFNHGFSYGSNLPKNMIVCDYMQLFKTYDTSIDVKENNKLDWVGDAVLGLKKIKYNGDLTQLYVNDYQKYVLYNAVDTYLVKMIDERTECLNSHLSLSYITKQTIYKTYSTIPLAENVLQEKFLSLGKHFLPNTDKSSEDKELPGGYVKTPIKGFYRDICVLDFSSLYPSIMRQFNLSPETFLGMSKDFSEDVIKENIKTAHGALISKERGVLTEILEDIYTRRKLIQKDALQIDNQLELIKKEMKRRGIQ
jgi:DNA polymerase elongation subunit (family B)